MNQSCIADIDRYDTGALKCRCQTLIQTSLILGNPCMLSLALMGNLLVEVDGEVAGLYGTG